MGFPTETVYGLGGDGLHEESSRKIYEAKGRPSDNPLIVHVADMEHLENGKKFSPLKKILLFKRFHGLSKLFVCYSHKERSGNEIALLCFPDLLILLFFCSFLLYSFLSFYSFPLYSFLSFLFFPTLFSLHFRFSIPGSGCFFICSFSLPYNWVIRYNL